VIILSVLDGTLLASVIVRLHSRDNKGNCYKPDKDKSKVGLCYGFLEDKVAHNKGEEGLHVVHDGHRGNRKPFKIRRVQKPSNHSLGTSQREVLSLISGNGVVHDSFEVGVHV